jgi:hypothetical protein
MAEQPEFPTPLDIGGQVFFPRSRLEHYKRQIIARAVGGKEPEYEEPTVEEFVPARVAAKELGFGRRTLGRRIAGLAKNSVPAADGEAA